MVGRTLLVMRHAKSSWSTGRPDHDRPLNARGRADAPRMARALVDRGWMPDHVWVSDAERTRETLAFMEHAIGQELAATTTPDLYLAPHDAYLAIVRQAPDALRTLMFLGHNPGCEDTVLYLTGDDLTLTTANVARLVAPDLPWPELVARPCRWRLDGLLRPKDFAEPGDVFDED
ncbi:MAG: histidine phosphatase family protein [Alphaproteobacteria bacterium]|nr:histidine phosphatase family protein [Alphaproteobacteria bacterium]